MVESKRALIIVDAQLDFMPGGALPVHEGDLIVPVLNKYLTDFEWDLVVATRDWHPAEMTQHFASWPKHCIQQTLGAELHPELALPDGAYILSKGVDPDFDGYSGFAAECEDGTTLEDLLFESGIQRLYIGGLATDFCVKETVLSALQLEYQVTMLLDASRAVNVAGGDTGRRAIEEMRKAGSRFTTLKYLRDRLAREGK